MSNVVVVVLPSPDEEIAKERAGISLRQPGTQGSSDLPVDQPKSKTVRITIALCLNPAL